MKVGWIKLPYLLLWIWCYFLVKEKILELILVSPLLQSYSWTIVSHRLYNEICGPESEDPYWFAIILVKFHFPPVYCEFDAFFGKRSKCSIEDRAWFFGSIVDLNNCITQDREEILASLRDDLWCVTKIVTSHSQRTGFVVNY